MTSLQHRAILYLFTHEVVYWNLDQIAEETGIGISGVIKVIEEYFKELGYRYERETTIDEHLKIERK